MRRTTRRGESFHNVWRRDSEKVERGGNDCVNEKRGEERWARAKTWKEAYV